MAAQGAENKCCWVLHPHCNICTATSEADGSPGNGSEGTSKQEEREKAVKCWTVTPRHGRDDTILTSQVSLPGRDRTGTGPTNNQLWTAEESMLFPFYAALLQNGGFLLVSSTLPSVMYLLKYPLGYNGLF